MPRSKKTTASAIVTKSAIDYATSTLEELPEKPKENWSLREAVAYLQVQISSALSKGYSYEEVAGMLTERGIEISASSLKSYLSAAKRQKETAAPKTGRTGRRSRKALGENLMVIEAVPSQSSSNGTAEKASKSLNEAKPEAIASQFPEGVIADSEPANDTAPTKRRTRSSAKSSANSTQKSTASKTAAKSKSAPRTQSTTEGTKGTRSKRQRQA
ncbi:hypothetical protein [Leptolyngbya sp. FACHB-711]|jgi:hypothetical protein|uniref:hypothetical protein n=1 Tax=unclassified Leptolyngbya TaxID=2650499 RepID=UPI001685DFB5|nr:hypothetical protein [Leptolyngbya sp. FACHB-711]MBD1852248.1 hypothetical protein [Cyanobacteria bacterium FACHB-502]MBD2022841.1 hypothetical protein [Leptolyngbya sp. FACHB-711]